jgi:Rrf2 family nitric oxide-sensitive transcriptional repressor
MQLTRFSDYALRILLYLGSHPGQVVPASAISDAYDISPDHLAKIAKWLTQQGYVVAQRGKNGGISLEKRPDSIRIGTLIRETEPHDDLLECFDATINRCPLTSACRLKQALQRAHGAFFAVLDEYTLADLLGNQRELLQLLTRKRR